MALGRWLGATDAVAGAWGVLPLAGPRAMAAMAYMLTTILLASVLVVLMLGVANMHQSLHSVQAEIAEQSRTLKSVHMARLDALAGQVQRWSASSQKKEDVQKMVQTLLAETRPKFDADIQKVAEDLVTVRQEVTGDQAGIEALKQQIAEQMQSLSDLAKKVQQIEHDHENMLQEITSVHEHLEAQEAAPVPAEPAPAAGSAPVAPEPGLAEPALEAQSARAAAPENQQQDAAREQFGGRWDILQRAENVFASVRDSPLAIPSIWPVGSELSERRRVAWFRECGCTGMEIESVLVLSGLAEVLGEDSIRTNQCADTCTWTPGTRSLLDRIEVEEYALLRADGNVHENYTLVLVVHAGYLGVCGFPDKGDLFEHDGVLRVSRSMFETDRLDNITVEQCNSGRFDAIWVPSEFNRQTFARAGVLPELLAVLPEAVDTTLYNCSDGTPPQRSRIRPLNAETGVEILDRLLAAPVDGSTFTFLSVFKWEMRKNWMGLLSAFARTFPDPACELPLPDGSVANVTVRLLIKTQALSWGTVPSWDLESFYSYLDPDTVKAIRPRIVLVPERIKAETLGLVYRAVDAFVLPTHGEGWGLPLIEAMAVGLPTIATGWGGQTEFMDATNSYLVGYSMVPTMDDNLPGHLWAEANLTDLENAMLDVAMRSGESFAKAAAACDVTTKFSMSAMASRTMQLVEDLLSELAAFPPDEAVVPGAPAAEIAIPAGVADAVADEAAPHADAALEAQQGGGQGEPFEAAVASEGKDL